MRVVVQIATQTEWSSLLDLMGDRAEPGEALGNQFVVANRTIVYDIDSGLDGGTNETIRTLTTDLQVPALPVPHHVGTVLTGDRDVTRHNIDSLRARFDGLIADWESGGIARVCKLNNVPCMVLRGVSDTPHADGADQFDSYIRNTPVVMNRLWHVLTEHILG